MNKPQEETAVATQAPKTIGAALEERRATIQSLLPSHVNIERFIKSALLAYNRDPNLRECTLSSLVTTVVNAAELGLDFTPAKGYAYIVKFGDTATFMPGYRGFIALAVRSGSVKYIDVDIVHKNDYFEFEKGMNPKIIHRPCLTADVGDVVGTYAIAYFSDGSILPAFMRLDELDKIEASSKARSGPWKSWKEEMQKKSAVRRLQKLLPQSPELALAAEYDNAATGILDEEPDTRTGTERLVDKIARKPASEPTDAEIVTDPPATAPKAADGLFPPAL